MKSQIRTKRLSRLLTGLLLILASCGGSGHMQPTTAPPATPEPAASGDTEPGTAPAARQTLTLSTPALVGLSPGSELEAVLGASFADEIHQGSARLLFDAGVLQPVAAEVGELLPSGMLSIVGLQQAGHVPFSFTALPGGQGIAPGTGELLTVRFRVVATPQPDTRIRLLNEPEFLQLRDREGQRLGFELESNRGVR